MNLEFEHIEGETLHLVGDDDARFQLAVTDPLRTAIGVPQTPDNTTPEKSSPTCAAVDSPELSAYPADTAPLRPRDIQVRLRAGASVEDLVALTGLPHETVQRYEWPIITERDHVIRMVRSRELIGFDGKRVLDNVVNQRLSARGVNPDDVFWSARRDGTAPWEVTVRFSVSERERTATWSYDLRSGTLIALDDEARWLAQPDDPVIAEIVGSATPLTPVPRPSTYTGPRLVTENDHDTEDLLAELDTRRGRRPAPLAMSASSKPALHPTLRCDTPESPTSALEPVPLDAESLPTRNAPPTTLAAGDDEIIEDTTSSAERAAVVEIDRWNPKRPRAKAPAGASQPALLTASGSPVDHETVTTPAVPHARPSSPARGTGVVRKRGRAKVPSWDEIVFGNREPDPAS